jgi:hypothetical protein
MACSETESNMDGFAAPNAHRLWQLRESKGGRDLPIRPQQRSSRHAQVLALSAQTKFADSKEDNRYFYVS